MTRISQRCQYGLRALLELARRQGQGPVPVSEIAKAQAVPQRFLELIVKDLRRAGILQSTRGAKGGYVLETDPAELTVGEIIRLFDGPMSPVDCVGCGGERPCPLVGECVFAELWTSAEKTINKLYDATTFRDLLDRDIRREHPDYVI